MSTNQKPAPLRIGVLLSGEGTSLENLFEHIEAGKVPAEVVLVVSSKEDVGGLRRAERRGVPAVAIPRKRHRDQGEFNDLIHAELEKHGVEFVALLGFLSVFELRGKFEGRTINVHPALIPAFSGQGFYGKKVYDAVFEKGVKVTGATVHFADEEYDHGPIILQEAVSVLEEDTYETLSARVQAAERRLVPEAIRLFAEGRLEIDDQHRVRIHEPE
jgi:formyltetrahydrofolate-dependent phosphoribosylglycinamide formyltransferase